MTNQSNIEARRQQVFEEAETVGETEGRGAVARAAFAIKLVEWSSEGVVDVSDAESLYDKYMGQSSSIQQTFGGAKKIKNENNGRKQNVSKFRQFLKMGGNKKFDPVLVISDAARLVKEERAKGSIQYPPFDALLNIARKQNHDDYCEDPLPAEVMLSCNQPKERSDRVEADALDAEKRRLEKLNDLYQSTELEEAIESLAARIVDLGGTTKQQRDAQRAADKAAKKNGGATATV
jgi:hypothetical protein